MWENSGFKECTSGNALVASDGSGGSRDFLGVQVPGRQTVPRAEPWGAMQILSRVAEKSNIQIPIDAKYVTRGVTHRGDSEQGPNGGLVVSPVPADRRAQWGHRCHQSQVTPGRCAPTSCHAKQDRLPPHAC